MRRAVGLALLLAALMPAGASAAVPGPTFISFEGASGTNPVIEGARFTGECPPQVQSGGAHDGTQFLRASCPPLFVDLPSGQSTVSAFVRLTPTATGSGVTSVSVSGYDATGQIVVASTSVPDATNWTPIVLKTNDGAATIRRVVYSFDFYSALDLDEFAFSPTAQPDVDITDGPSGTVSAGDATFQFAGNQDRMQFFCKLDNQPSEACSSPKSYSGLAAGDHTFTVIGRDRWGTNDPTPAGRTWTIQPVAPPSDRDRDGIPDASDNCPDNANASQGDADKDGIGDACEVLPSGNTPPEAGKVATVELLAGDVFVKLPPGATKTAFTSSLRVPFQSSGFLPLKGVAAVPMGSTLDTRKGEVALTAAVNGQPARSPKQLRREARFRAGIFQIKQARKRKKAKASKTIPPSATLVSAAGAEKPCAPRGPGKGIAVRSLSMTAKGVFRAVGGAATATPAKGTATFITTDRCDGTVTEVGRGSVAVIAKKGGKRRVVKAGRAYIVRARLFQAKKNRRG
jgi:hypothetical protein